MADDTSTTDTSTTSGTTTTAEPTALVPQRSITIPAQWAGQANTIIPAPPIPGQSYRKASLTATEMLIGQGYSMIADSAQWNALHFMMTSMLMSLEQFGILPWSSLTNYPVRAMTLGSNGRLYYAASPSGPGNSSPQDPVADIAGVYWTDYITAAFKELPIAGPATATVDGTPYGVINLAADNANYNRRDIAVTPAGMYNSLQTAVSFFHSSGNGMPLSGRPNVDTMIFARSLSGRQIDFNLTTPAGEVVDFNRQASSIRDHHFISTSCYCPAGWYYQAIGGVQRLWAIVMSHLNVVPVLPQPPAYVPVRMVIPNAVLPERTVGTAWSYTIQVTGGSGSYTWTTMNGPTVFLNNQGVLSIPATATANYDINVTVTVRDSNNAGLTDTRTVQIPVTTSGS